MGQLDVLLQKSGSNNKTTTLKSSGSSNLDTLLSTNKGKITVSAPKKSTTVKVTTAPPKTDLVSQTKVKTNNLVAQSKTLINQNKPKAKGILDEAKKMAIDTAKDVGYALVSPIKDIPASLKSRNDPKMKVLVAESEKLRKAEQALLKKELYNKKTKTYNKEVQKAWKELDKRKAENQRKQQEITAKYGGLTPEQIKRAEKGSEFAFTFTKAGGGVPEAGAVSGNVGFILRQSKNGVTNKIVKVLPKGEVEANDIVNAVIKTGTEKTPEGKAVIKGALDAKSQGKKVEVVEVSAKDLGFTGDDVAKGKVTKVSIDDIDSGLSPMMKDKKLNVDPMIDTLKKGEDLPAIPVYKDGNKYVLNSDGNRRYQAYKQAGIKEVPVKIEEKTKLTPLAKNNAERAIVEDSKIIEEANKFKNADEFFLRMDRQTRNLLRDKNIKSQEAIKDWFNKNAKPKDEVLDTLNPTGNVIAEYSASKRATMPLGKNITTLDKTMNKSGDETITIYRGVSKKYNTINAGDFVTTNKDLAKSYSGEGNVVSKQVKLKDILDDKTEPLGDEYIYRPQKSQVKPKPEKPKEVVSEKTIKTETTKKPSYTSKEARTVQESFSNDIQRVTHNAKSEQELINNTNKIYDEALAKAKGDRSALAGLRTSINKEMFEFAGIKGGNYKANYAELKTLMDSPDIGKYLSSLEKKVQDIDDLILKTPEKTKVITKKTEKVITTKEIPKPIGKGETKQSGLAVGVEAKAIEKKLADNLGDLPEYKQVNMKDQASKAQKLLDKDEKKAIDIALGKNAPPGDILPESVFIAVENKAIREGNVDLLRQLASSIRTTEATAMGQRIRALKERMIDSPTKLMSDIINERKKAFETKFKGRSEADVMNKEVSKIKSKVKAPDKYDWNKFVESIAC